MNITLNKIIELHTARVYLRFQKEEERKDIQDYLNGRRFERIINDRINDYLKHIGIYDEQYQLTKKGDIVKNTGRMYVAEEGKYQIWFTQKDSLLGNKIVYFKRVQPNNHDEVKDQINLDEKGHYLLPNDSNKCVKLDLLSDNTIGQRLPHKETLHLSWVWPNLKDEASYYYFSGQLGNNDKSTTIKSEAILSPEPMQSRINEILPEWDKSKMRYKVPFDYLNEQSRATFKESKYTSRWMGFDVAIENLPLMPYDKESAEKWRNWLLNEVLKKDHINPNDFEKSVTEVNEKSIFDTFYLDAPNAKEFIPKVNSKPAFWHLNAPIDLNPNTKIVLLGQPIGLKKGDRTSFDDIVNKLGISNSSFCVYYDQYVRKPHQQKAAIALMNAINSPQGTIITNLSEIENGNDFIQRHQTAVNLRDNNAVFKSRSPHDRYLIVGNRDNLNIWNIWNIWNITNSLDYITFDSDNITKNTVGRIKQNVLFTPIPKELLDKELLVFINSEINEN